MDFNFLSRLNFQTYPEISPLLSNNFHQSDPFYIQDEEESFIEENDSPLIQSIGKDNNNNDNNNSSFPEIKNEKRNIEESFSLDISPRISGILQSNFLEPEDKIEIGEECKPNLKMTNPTTDKTKGKTEITKKEIFGIKTQKKMDILPRIDYAIKNFKVNAVKYIKDHANELIRKCKLKGELKNTKLFAPSNKYFTGVSNEKENKVFLDFTVAEIFYYPNLEFGKDIRLQQDNKKTIMKLRQKFDDIKELPEEYQELKTFLDMTFADAVILFYKSEEFVKYKQDERTLFLDSQFIKVKGFSLLKSNAFLELMRHSSDKI